MKEEQAAIHIYQSRTSNQDVSLRILEVLNLSKSLDISKIIEIYQKLLNKEISLVTIRASFKIDANQLSEINELLKKNIDDEYIINNVVDETLRDIEITVNDRQLVF